MAKINTENLVKAISDLVKFKTTERNFREFAKAVNYVEKFFDKDNLFIRKHYFNGFPALFISVKNTKKPRILLQGHLDVVNATEEQFIPKIRNNKLFGRGTVDMKGFVAMAMYAMKEFAEEEVDVGLIITFDEEIGSENGTKKMVEEEKYSCEILFNGDGGYNYSVIHGEKGILKFNLKTKSNPGRHPYPWEGKNAFDLFLEDYLTIQNLFPENAIATSEDNWHTTYSLYDINVFNDEFYPPKKLTAKMNIYFTEKISTKELLDKIKFNLKHTEIESFSMSERVYINPNSPYITRLREIMENNFARPIQVRTENGSSDARFFAGSGIPIVIVKTVGEDHHGINEHILISELLPMYRSILDFVKLFSNKRKEQKVVVVHNENE